MKLDRDDIGTLALFTFIGPLIGLFAIGVMNDGLPGLLLPLIFMGFCSIMPLVGLFMFAVLGMLPAAISAMAGLSTRNLGHPNLFIPAAVIGGVAGSWTVPAIAGVHIPGEHLVASAWASIACGVIDVIARWRLGFDRR